MNEAMNSKVCERAEDLISFLYGELDDREARSFTQHRRECSSCQAELASFGSVRESVVAWRDQILAGGAQAFPANANAASLTKAAKPSALAAIRGFFALSPLWLKTATAFAMVLFCLLAGLAVFRAVEKTPDAIVTSPGPTQTAAEFEAAVNQRVEAELASRQKQEVSGKTFVVKDTAVPHKIVRSSGPNSKELAIAGPQKLRKPLTRAEREQLAADLRLISAEDEDSLELLGDGINNR